MRASVALTVALFGAAGMFLLDPSEGRRRRGQLRNGIARGAARFTTRVVSDGVLLGRVRARLLDLAAEAFFCLIVQRESLGLVDADRIAADYGVSREILTRVGIYRRR